ncbi:SUMF1/EgtB/PvdO family nonheme iron enzyme [Shewanella sp. KX20019]|uniref:formylglycine-generating enzyme family protein n=1 Tax=Shewanella sp. KX20019 TaxID=2803864 RepID=UPI001925D086|nr:SUMF1/EgtB/PvdO family nonheme iron enzyme [Shewanella sp. KX20019]QQX78355.1 SUMF1/EgtB/PvdO family nonheme iron enzyme [Shewanella sp. KX20019]
MRLSLLSVTTLLSLTLIQGCASSIDKNINVELKQQIMSEMVWVEGGEFSMGSACGTGTISECPARLVSVDSFYIGQYEVTQGLFDSVLSGSSPYFPGAKMPMNNLSWQQAKYFISQLNLQTGLQFRLPTEAEWEYAAKGGTKSKGYRYSGSNDIDSVGWYVANSANKAHQVGLKQPNELGLYDMTGNVGEMVEDAFDTDYYHYGPSHNPLNSIESTHHLAYKSVRGGSLAYDTDESANSSRDSASQSAIMPDIGLRLVLSVN